MGFMDKAKQMADQAQQKIEEAQKQFNDEPGQKSPPSAGGGVRYDDHGRPIQDAPPAAEAPPAPVDTPPTRHAGSRPEPAAEAPAEQPAASSRSSPTPEVKDGVERRPGPVQALISNDLWRRPHRDGHPVRPDGGLDEDAAADLIRHLLDNGSDGLVLAGTTGEGSTLDDDEKVRALGGSGWTRRAARRSSPAPAPTTPATRGADRARRSVRA